MKHIFIFNPAAGGNCTKEILKNKLDALNEKIDYEIFCTEYIGHAKLIVKEYIENHSTEELRFYACGGDGTINEVASSVCNKNVEMAVVPLGSGNDFVKYFGGMEKFSDLNKVVNGNLMPVDILQVGENYSINVCNFGFEAMVGKIANEVKLKGGKNPYGVGVRKAIFKGMKHNIKVEVDGKIINGKAKMLLCTLANAHYVGGKYKCAPRAVINDGLIEVCLIDPISLISFIMLIGKYEKGTHLELNKKFIHYTQGKNIKLTSDKDFDICLDGEIVTGNNFEIKILPNAVNFVVPKE